MLRLELINYETIKKNITIVKNSHYLDTFMLKHTKLYSDSIASYAVKNKNKMTQNSKLILRISTVTLGMVLYAGGVYFNGKANNHIENQDQNIPYDKDVDKYIKYRNILYGVAGCCAVGFTISYLY
jgi:hypothetical protein